MEQRENALREAIQNNAEETERWETYKKEQEVAIDNLKEFSKHLTVDVMVPIGKKAFMNGHLIHTNEVLVGHYQGYFSKCSAHKAMEICDLRIKTATEQLKKFQAEAEFWQNKLYKPHLEGVLPSLGEHEIIEEYDEEQEKRWREEHKIKVKRAKLKEKEQRDAEEGNEELTISSSKLRDSEKQGDDDDILKILQDSELVEELQNELQQLEIEEVSDETIRRLMAGEMELPQSKKRTAHKPSLTSEISLNGVIKKDAAAEVKQEKPLATNNNTCVNPEINVENDSNSTEDDNELPEEVRLIKDQAQFLLPSDKVGFYEYQVEIIRNKVAKLRLTKESDIEEKLHLLTVQSELEDLLALAEDEMVENMNESENENNTDATNEKQIDDEEIEEQKPTQKRRISFSYENETLVFRKTEAVSQLLKDSPTATIADCTPIARDIITLDEEEIPSSSNCNNIIVQYSPPDSRKSNILKKVETNRKYIMENQSISDCDIITKIIDESMPLSSNKTIYIKFKHSENDNDNYSDDIGSTTGYDDDEDTDNFIPRKPSDFYDIYLKQQKNELNQQQSSDNIYLNSYIGEESVKVPILKEVNREIVYEDPRAKFSNPISNGIDNIENRVSTTKSILRNKSAVEQEAHKKLVAHSSKKSKKKQSSSIDEDEYMSAYYKVMNDVIEKPLTEPDPLPQEKFVDAHAPKKRVSRFKQSRSEKEKT